MEMIEVRVREQIEIDGREVADFEPRTFDAFEEKEPVGKIRIDEDVEVGELDQEGGVADPGDGDLALGEFWENGALMLAGAASQEGFPDHLVKEGARVKMLGGGEVCERAGQRLAARLRFFWHARPC